MAMKALSMTEPWATLVCLGKKRLETRSWATKYRGPLAIHAAKGMPKEARALLSQTHFRSALGEWGLIRPFNLGHIIGVVNLVECTPTEELTPPIESAFGDFGPKRYVWRLESPRLLNIPIPCTGHLSVWTVPDEILACIPMDWQEEPSLPITAR